MSLLFFCGVASLITLGFLVHVIKRTFTDELNREMIQLIVSQIIFVFTFILRCGLFVLLIVGHWVNFTEDYPNEMPGPFLTAMFPLQFFIYNIIPYCTLMLLHYRNYKPK